MALYKVAMTSILIRSVVTACLLGKQGRLFPHLPRQVARPHRAVTKLRAGRRFPVEIAYTRLRNHPNHDGFSLVSRTRSAARPSMSGFCDAIEGTSSRALPCRSKT